MPWYVIDKGSIDSFISAGKRSRTSIVYNGADSPEEAVLWVNTARQHLDTFRFMLWLERVRLYEIVWDQSQDRFVVLSDRPLDTSMIG